MVLQKKKENILPVKESDSEATAFHVRKKNMATKIENS